MLFKDLKILILYFYFIDIYFLNSFILKFFKLIGHYIIAYDYDFLYQNLIRYYVKN